MKFINDDEPIETDFGYDRLDIRYKNCVTCKKCNAEKKAAYRKDVKNKLKHMLVMTQI